MSPELERWIGIIGGGQLGFMLALAAIRMGFDVRVLDPTPNCPASRAGADQIVAGLKDEAATRELARLVRFLTVEIEHINTAVLHALAEGGVDINPFPKTLDMIKDKFLQKEFLKNAGIPVAESIPVRDKQEILEVAQRFGYPFLLKSRLEAYDGKGNAKITSEAEIDAALERFGDNALYMERFVPFEKELAVMAARGKDESIELYPVVETIQRNNVCEEVIAPAPIDEESRQKAEDLARKVMKNLEGAGVFGIEMFMLPDGSVVVNEIAPRVHNSGHYTEEACDTSQFEQHIRAIVGLPLGKTDMKVGAAVMMNILGDTTGTAQLVGLEQALAIPGTHLTWYNKKDVKKGRKMGHLVKIGDDAGQVLADAREARRRLVVRGV